MISIFCGEGAMQLPGQDEGVLIALSCELDAEPIGDFVTAAVNDGQGSL